MPIYEVQITEERYITLFVEADKARQAEDIAFELSSSEPSHVWEVDFTDQESVVWDDSERLPAGTKVWVGGAKGRWKTV